MSPGLLTLAQWLSPAFPTGAFACSHGMETAIADGRLTSAQQVQDWVADLLRHGSGWQDALLLAAGLEPDAALDALTDLALALAASAERWAETRDQGSAFARTLGQYPPRPLPLALAQAARPLGVPVPMVVALYLNSFATNLVTIATRAVPLGQTEAQGILAALRPLMLDLADRAACATFDDLAASCLAADLAALAHETLQPRLYRT